MILLSKNIFYLLISLLFVNSESFTVFVFSNSMSTLLLQNNGQLIVEAPLNISSGTVKTTGLSANTLQGSNITFNQGYLQTSGLSSLLTGNYDPTSTDQINLTGNGLLDVQSGVINTPINVSGNGNLISGRLLLEQPIFLSNGADVSLTIQTPLNQNINLLNGTLILGSDLKLGESIQLVGPGSVSCAGNRLTFGTSPLTITETTTFVNSANIEMISDITLQNCGWIFADSGGLSYIHGNNNTIDLGQGGYISVASGHILILLNLNIKGIGDGGSDGKFVFADNLAIVKMRGCTLLFANDYTLSNGQIYLFDSSTIFSTKGFNFYINGGAVVTIDTIALVWDRLSLNNDTNPITPATSANLSLINGGFVRSINDTLTPVTIFDSSNSLYSNVYVTAASNLTFSNANPLVPKSMSLNGNSNFIQFPRSDSIQSLIVQDNVSLTLSNIVLKDFNPDTISLGNDANIIFGDDVTLELGKDTVISKSFGFGGNVIVDGRGHILTLADNNSIVLSVAGKNLLLQNLTLIGPGGPNVGLGNGRIRCNHPDNSITFQNVTMFLDDDYNLSMGKFIINKLCRIIGRDKVFVYTSASQSQILPDSTWFFDLGTTFSYAADVGISSINGTAASYAQSRDRLFLSDITSTLCLNGATLHCTHTGLYLDAGILLIQDHSILRSMAGIDEGPYGHGAPSSGEEPVFRDSLIVKILSGATCDIEGKFIHA